MTGRRFQDAADHDVMRVLRRLARAGRRTRLSAAGMMDR
jgi:hypothetical protein